MSKPIKAFPACNEANVNGTMGMDLRDWFAGQALPGLISVLPTGTDIGTQYPEANKNIAMVAYILADAMIAVRNGETK